MARQPHQLPAGRHGLPRSDVLTNQRERIITAVIEVVRETGYAGLTVGQVVERAGVSRRTFYEHFSNKEDVFLAVYDTIVQRLAAEVRLAFAGGRTYPQRVAFGLETFLGELAAHPALAHVCVVEVLAAGPGALARRTLAIQTFCELIEPPGEPVAATPALAAQVVVGGIYEIVFSYVIRGDAAQLPRLCPDLLECLLLPFVGPRRAAGEARRAHERGVPPLPRGIFNVPSGGPAAR
jgi:AcrR family transcriptional regulator